MRYSGIIQVLEALFIHCILESASQSGFLQQFVTVYGLSPVDGLWSAVCVAMVAVKQTNRLTVCRAAVEMHCQKIRRNTDTLTSLINRFLE